MMATIAPKVFRSGRDGQGIANRPSVIKPPAQSAFGESSNGGPFGKGMGFAVKLDDAIIALVVGLLCRRGPSAIVRPIVAVCVDAVNRIVASWAWPHVGVEVIKRFTPTVAHLHTSFAIKVVLRIVWVGASLVHVAPRLIFWRAGHAMLKGRQTGLTSATSPRSIRSQKLAGNQNGGVAALALAKPLGIGIIPANIADNGQAAELTAIQVLSYGRGNGYNLLSHVRTSFTNVMRGLMGVDSTQQSPLFYHNTVVSSMVCQI